MTTTSQESVPGTGTPLSSDMEILRRASHALAMPKGQMPDLGTPLPTLPELHERARLLSGLVDAMDELAELIGPRGTPIYAIIQAAVPMARDLARDLDRGGV